jgi:hypothetical protein
VNDLSKTEIKNLTQQYKEKFPTYQKHQIHSTFLVMQIDSNSFDTAWNRDFSIEYNCPKGEQRGGQDYHPPEGYFR